MMMLYIQTWRRDYDSKKMMRLKFSNPGDLFSTSNSFFFNVSTPLKPRNKI